MAIEIPKDRSITGEEARQAFVFGLEKVLKQKVDPDWLWSRSMIRVVCVSLRPTLRFSVWLPGRVPRSPVRRARLKAAA